MPTALRDGSWCATIFGRQTAAHPARTRPWTQRGARRGRGVRLCRGGHLPAGTWGHPTRKAQYGGLVVPAPGQRRRAAALPAASPSGRRRGTLPTAGSCAPSCPAPSAEATPLPSRPRPSAPAREIMVVLKGVPALLSPELLYALARMGHGDEIGEGRGQGLGQKPGETRAGPPATPGPAGVRTRAVPPAGRRRLPKPGKSRVLRWRHLAAPSHFRIGHPHPPHSLGN